MSISMSFNLSNRWNSLVVGGININSVWFCSHGSLKTEGCEGWKMVLLHNKWCGGSVGIWTRVWSKYISSFWSICLPVVCREPGKFKLASSPSWISVIHCILSWNICSNIYIIWCIQMIRTTGSLVGLVFLFTVCF